MRVLFDITHPAHVHFFRNAIQQLTTHGHDIIITSRNKDIAISLLDRYELPHTDLGPAKRGLIGLGFELLQRGIKLWRIVRRQQPDVLCAIGATFIAPVGRITGIPTLLFTDTENATISNALAFPCAALIVTPECYRSPVPRKKHLSYKGYHELAYLHPKTFTPDPVILDELGIAPGAPFVIVRFVSWGASHDVGHKGLTLATKQRAVVAFSKYATVFITSEKALPEDLEPYRIQISPDRIHHALYYATLLYGESATMASEAAVLGTPAIFIDDIGRGYTAEQEERYGAVFNFTESPDDQQRSIECGVSILKNRDVQEEWKEKRTRLLKHCIDVTDLIVELVEDHKERVRNVRHRGHSES